MKNVSIIFILVFSFHTSFSQSFSEKTNIPFGIRMSIFSNELKEQRFINIYLPEDYKENDTAKYPVIYLLDGGLQEDFFHIASLVRFDTQPWINLFPKSIVVGIENTNRKKDFTFPVDNLNFLKSLGWDQSVFPSYGGSAAFISFLKNELQPFIERKFHTAIPRTIIGESLGGLLATEILLKHTELFDNYIIVAPSLWWDNESLLKHKISLSPDHPVKIYIAAPNEKEDERMYADAVKLRDALLEKSSPFNSITWEYIADETHATVLHEAVYRAFRWLSKKDFNF